jgi:hypothetical protein
MSEKQPRLNLIANQARGGLKTDPNGKEKRKQILEASRELRTCPKSLNLLKTRNNFKIFKCLI